MDYKILILILINVTLAIFIFRFLRNKKAKEESDRQSLDNFREKRKKNISESIHSISSATLQGQVEISETVIRLKKLLELIEIPESIDARMKPIKKMYIEISDFAILEARNELSLKEVTVQDKRRFEIERVYQEQILECCKELKLYFDDQFQLHHS